MEKEAMPADREFELLELEDFDKKTGEKNQSNVDAVQDALKEIRI